jgi:predicted metalloendopeptidase
MRVLTIFAAVLTLCAALDAQTTPAAAPDAMPTLERFSPDQVDKTLDPCADFFKYACSKWITANPIPPDQVSWGTFNALAIWNVAAIHRTLEDAAKSSPSRSPVQQQVGDYYAACMDEAAINKAGITPLQPELDRIA